MGLWSFIDSGLQDFLRDENGTVVKIEGSVFDAEEWLLQCGIDCGWTNEGTKYYDWEDDE